MSRQTSVTRGATLRAFLCACLCITAALLLSPAPARAGDWDGLVNQLAADGLDRELLDELFSRPEARFDPSSMGHKMLTLFKVKYGSRIVREMQAKLVSLGYDAGPADGFAGLRTRWAISEFQRRHDLPMDGKPSDTVRALLASATERAPEGLTPQEKPQDSGPEVYTSLLTARRLAEARAFYQTNRDLLAEVRQTYGVPEEIAVALLTVETRLGSFLGEHNAFVTLASMAACDELSDISPYLAEEQPTPEQRRWLRERMAQKTEWAYNEIKALITYCDDNDLDPLSMPGSIYGAVGICQFMPSSALKWGVDGDQDGAVNLFGLADAVHSMANYLHEHGWQGDTTSERGQRRALYGYNHSQAYVNTIMALAAYLRRTGAVGG